MSVEKRSLKKWRSNKQRAPKTSESGHHASVSLAVIKVKFVRGVRVHVIIHLKGFHSEAFLPIRLFPTSFTE
jgi:hypothetical protein